MSQWRFGIGTFNSIYVHMKCGKITQQPYLAGWVFNILVSLTEVVPLKICFGLVKVFIFNFIVILLLPIFLISYPHLKFFYDILAFEHYPECTFSRCFIHAFSKMIYLPTHISGFITYMPSLFKNLLSEKTKNIFFFVIVLQILLFISGSVEINPGPPSPKEKELSFAVWNLDSLPARDFARIPLIETLQSIC